MKKILLVFFLITAFMSILTSCNSDEPTQPTISISDDGYVVVNGIKTEYEVNKPDEVTVSDDGYLVVNGIKTEYEVKDNNHTFDEWKLYNEDTTNCEKKIYYRVCSDCATIEWKDGKYNDHSWNTITTKPTCQEGGYDTKTCVICGAVEICNSTPISNHTYSESFLSDGYYHWKECTICHTIDFKGEHIINGDNTNCSTCDTPIKATVGIIYEISTDGTYVAVTGYEGTSTKVKIAEEYDGIPVKVIYSEAFKNKNITDVIIPNGVTDISSRAFYACRNLIRIEIPNSVTNIGSLAFYECWKLSNIELPNGLVSIGNQAFYECSSLENIVIPDSVTSSIGEYTFEDCTSLKTVVVGNSVSSIGTNAFNGCTALESITIGNSVKGIGYMAFLGCTSLKSIVIPDSITSITSYAFYKCSALENVVIGNNVKSIGEKAFQNCSALKNVTMGKNVKNIGDAVFYGCSLLQSIVLPISVTSIGDEAFSGCSSLSDVYYSGNETAWNLIEIGERNYSLTGATRHYNYIYEE